MTIFQKSLFLIALGTGLFLVSTTLALTEDDIVFPVAELENCANEQECRLYCDNPANIDQCIAFAVTHGLLSEDELEKAEKFRSIGAVGPGGCQGELECEAYCSNVQNIDSCLAFAEQNGFMEPEELAEAKKIQAALRSGAQLPGGCTNKQACETYCSDPGNMRACVEFAEAAGFMSERELQEAKQVLKALDAGLKLPGNCKGERECDLYCSSPNNAEECVEFALAAGFIPPEEAEEVRRILPLMKSGKMPQACRGGKEACEAYCSQEQNAQECTTFFIEAGFMTPEEAELFRKTGGKGPGGCAGEQECNDFCNSPENQESCFAFATEHGLIEEEELANIKEGVGRFKEGIQEAPPAVAQCLKDRIGQDVLDKIEAGTFLPNPQIGEHMKSCFEEFLPRDSFNGEPGFDPPGGFDESVTEEQKLCVERILSEGGFQGPPSPEAEARISQECFSRTAEEFRREEFQEPVFKEEFRGESFEEFEGAVPLEFEGFSPEELERMFREEEEQRIRGQFEQEFQEQQQQLEQFQEFEDQLPPAEGSLADAFFYFLRLLLP